MNPTAQQQSPWKHSFVQLFCGRPEDSALSRATRVAASVVLLMLLALAFNGLLRWGGLMPDYLPFSWSGFGEELLVKPTGAFFIVLFLHLLRWLIRIKRRGLALLLTAATGPLCFTLFLLTFGWGRVFSSDVLTDAAIVTWLVLFLVPVIFWGVVTTMGPIWIGTEERIA